MVSLSSRSPILHLPTSADTDTGVGWIIATLCDPAAQLGTEETAGCSRPRAVSLLSSDEFPALIIVSHFFPHLSLTPRLNNSVRTGERWEGRSYYGRRHHYHLCLPRPISPFPRRMRRTYHLGPMSNPRSSPKKEKPLIRSKEPIWREPWTGSRSRA